MEAYATVDVPVRRKLEEMLKTWKQPVPGSIDTRPVFPLDVVTPIETALMKAQASARQAQESLRGQQQYLGRPRSALQARDTPTPPGTASHRGPPLPPNGVRAEAYPTHQVCHSHYAFAF
jgi:pre-mRNA cleavage complex 2 protein Pcf11